jgi:FkbM family methyltransferase
MKPAVSICIPAYRQPILLKRTLESVFAQDFQDFEIIITDDSETNDVAEVIAHWRSDPRLIYQHNTKRLGSPANWNATMGLARADLIKFLHHDDWFTDTTSLRRFVEAINSGPGIEFVFSAANACEDDGQLIFFHCPTPKQIELLGARPLSLQFGNFIGAPSATIFRRRTGFQFDESLRWVVDMEAYIQLLGSKPKFKFIPEPLVSISSNGAHQVTRSVAADTVSRVMEHLSLYSKHTPGSYGERAEGFLFTFRLLSACTIQELKKLSSRKNQSLEERVVIFMLRLKDELSRPLQVLKKAIAKLTNTEVSGRHSYSQCGEDMIVDFLFMWIGTKDIVYLDIGAHHPTWLSNTYHLYRKGNRGVLIEPDADLCVGLRAKRPQDNVLNVAVGLSGDDTIPMYVMTSRTLNTLDQAQAQGLEAAGRERIEAVREVRRLGVNEILAQYFAAGKPNFVSLDVEGLDFAILQAWDFNRFRPQVFCVETLTYTQDNTERKLTEIIDLMVSRGYKVYADTFVNTIFVCAETWRTRPIYV